MVRGHLLRAAKLEVLGERLRAHARREHVPVHALEVAVGGAAARREEGRGDHGEGRARALRRVPGREEHGQLRRGRFVDGLHGLLRHDAPRLDGGAHDHAQARLRVRDLLALRLGLLVAAAAVARRHGGARGPDVLARDAHEHLEHGEEVLAGDEALGVEGQLEAPRLLRVAAPQHADEDLALVVDERHPLVLVAVLARRQVVVLLEALAELPVVVVDLRGHVRRHVLAHEGLVDHHLGRGRGGGRRGGGGRGGRGRARGRARRRGRGRRRRHFLLGRGGEQVGAHLHYGRGRKQREEVSVCARAESTWQRAMSRRRTARRSAAGRCLLAPGLGARASRNTPPR